MSRGRRGPGGLWLVAVGLVGLLVAVRLWMMATAPLTDTTEARYAELARRMLDSGDFVTPWFDEGVPFWGKPPLSFWLTAAGFQLFGLSEVATRLPHLLCVAGVALLAWQVGGGVDSLRGRYAAVLSAGSLGAFLAAGSVMTDATLLLGVTLMLAGFWRALHAESVSSRRIGQLWLFGGLAVGLLAKGPVALALGAPPIVAWTLLGGQLRQVWSRIAWTRGLLFTALLTLPWYALAEQRTPGFLEYFLLGEHWHRFVTPGWTGDLYGFAHHEPRGKIWLYGLMISLPWPLLLLFLRRHAGFASTGGAGEGRARIGYLLLWALWPLLFFTAARNIIWTYALPALPGAALLAAEWLSRCDARAVLRRLCVGLLLLAVSMGAAFEWRRDWIEAQSARAVVEAWRRERAPDQILAFAYGRPFSASFYGRGEPRGFPDVERAMSAASAQGGFVAVAEGRPRDPLSEAVSAGAASLIGRFGDFHLYRVQPTSSRQPAVAPGDAYAGRAAPSDPARSGALPVDLRG